MSAPIPFHDLKPLTGPLVPALHRAFRRVLARGRFILGQETALFEKEFAPFLGVPYCVGVGSGTDAITLALLALDIGPGDEVITSALTAYPTITGICQAGAHPVLVDVRADDGLMDPVLVRRAVSRRTKAIVPVHLYGQSCDMTPLLRTARQYGLKIVEDCAQSTGALYDQRPTGSMGDCGAFSFYPTKNLGAFGDAGAVTTSRPAVYRRLLRLRDYGRGARGAFLEPGINSRLDEIQAAFLRVKLTRLEGWIRARRRLAARYRQLGPKLCLAEQKGQHHAYHLFVVRVPHRSRVVSRLRAKGIGTAVHYPRPVNREKAFCWPQRGRFVQAEKLSREILSLPLYPGMTGLQVRSVMRGLNESLER